MMNIQKCVFSALIIFHSLLSAKIERWNVETSYQNIIENAQSGSAYYQGLLGIYLRSGEGGSSVNIELSRKWSNVAVKQDHPFGAYNLANLAMLKGDLVAATTLYQDAPLTRTVDSYNAINLVEIVNSQVVKQPRQKKADRAPLVKIQIDKHTAQTETQTLIK